ncbi:replication/maintenance protein RepL [Bacillus cereus]|nr:replication/maintenance protein RepL [Bacillus cereus]BCC56668.1 hypothetical protein BCJMU07_p65 [Bacillus cereus]
MSDKKKKLTTRKATKVIGTQTFINQETGELNEMQVINIEERDANFHKIWLGHIIESLDLIGNKKIKILSFIMQNINSDNLFLMTYDEMAKELSISKPTIVETMKALQSSNFLKKVRNGQYAINPDVIFKGNKTNRLNVLIQYQKNEEKEQIEQKKDEQHKED